MLLSRYLGSFVYYNIILFFLFSLSVRTIESFSIINSVSYVVLHYVIIYLGLYYYRNSLYPIYFLCGLGIDISLINQIGPHLLVFMILLIFFNLTKKYFNNFSSLKIYLLILFLQLIVILLDMFIANWLFNYDINLNKYLILLIISIIASYPLFFIFIKIDNL